MSSAGFLSAIVMELYGENAYFAESLPDGFYKWQYDRLHPFKLYLSTDEVDKYWKARVCILCIINNMTESFFFFGLITKIQN